jgi:hypothetical protein
VKPAGSSVQRRWISVIRCGVVHDVRHASSSVLVDTLGLVELILLQLLVNAGSDPAVCRYGQRCPSPGQSQGPVKGSGHGPRSHGPRSHGPMRASALARRRRSIESAACVDHFWTVFGVWSE